METPFCIIITSISGSENKVLQEVAQQASRAGAGFILAGDTKTPVNFNLPGCEFLSVEAQQAMPFRLAKLLPHRNYAKKNLAYLLAIQKGHKVLVETDDDNRPLPEFWRERSLRVNGDAAGNKSWINVYHYFSEAHIWPRGFSLRHIKTASPQPTAGASCISPIQQGLADENPDVDAIYRLSLPLPVYLNKRDPVLIETGSVCPFNSQNTTWFAPAFPLLYLPSHCSFRMTDIWRSFIAQRILWTCGWNLSFHNATVVQERNEHNLLRDFENEVSGYLHNESIVEALLALDLEQGEARMAENMRRCYALLVERNLVGKEELPLLDAWLEDLSHLT